VTVSLTVDPVNDAPVASFDSGETAEDTPLTVAAPGVLGNDSDVDLDTLSAALVLGPDHGSLTLNVDGSYLYTPDVDWNGDDSFTYTASDGTAVSNTATVTLTVLAVADAPVGAADAYTTDEDVLLTVAAPGPLANDTDADGDALSAVWISDPEHGTLTLNADGSFSYLPDANWNGDDSFTYQASDGGLTSAPVTVTLAVSPVNDAPVAVADAYSLDEDSVLTITAGGVLDNDTDVEGDALTAALDSGPLHGDLTLNADGSFSYTPDADWNGVDTFSYHAFDGQAASNTVTVTLTVDPINDGPVLLAALPDQTTLARTLYSFATGAYFGDIDSGDVLTFTAESADGSALPAWLSIDPASGVLSGTPDNAQVGNYALKITVSDGSASVSGEFTLTVEINLFRIFLPTVRR
jgi:VCBS repeat-containing protein